MYRRFKLGLPDRDGLDLLRGWRAQGSRVPVLVLTARDAWYERVDGFKAGADDYLGKPFHVEELVARLHALLRRTQAEPAAAPEAPRLRLDEDCQVVVRADGSVIPLTGTEFRLLRYFMLNPGKGMSKGRLSEHVYELDADRDSKLVHTVVVTAANVADITKTAELLHGAEQQVHADAGYTGVERRALSEKVELLLQLLRSGICDAQHFGRADGVHAAE